MPTIAQVFASKKLWSWFDSPVTNYFDGVHEKGQDYSTAYGTPVAAPVGGVVKRIVHNNNSINDVVEIMASDGSVWLYQHVSAKCKVGQSLQCGDVVGTENGLPVDQYSTGPHIETRYCPPGAWKPNIDSWLEPWVNPKQIFGSIGQQQAGTVSKSLLDSITSGSLTTTGSISISPNADVTNFLWALDQVMALKNPLSDVHAQQDSIAGMSFTDPINWIEQVSGNFIDDLAALLIRTIFLLLGIFVLYKVAAAFIDFGALAKTAQYGSQAIAEGGALL